MTPHPSPKPIRSSHAGWLQRLHERGVLRVAASYALITWLVLQIADVVLDPLGLPKRVMTALIIAAGAGFEAGMSCNWTCRIPLASLAANEGLKAEAIDTLQVAMRCGELPYGLQPSLPWFASLKGYAPYDALLRERERRIARARGSAATEIERVGSAAEVTFLPKARDR